MIKRSLISILIVAVASLITLGKASAADAPVLALADQPLPTIVTYFATQYSVDPVLALSVMECESHGIQGTVSDHGLSKGIFQIQQATWNRFTKEMGETLNIDSPMDQAKVATWAFANGHGGEWTTYVAIKKGGSYTFYDRLEHKDMTVHCSLEKTS